MLVSKSELNRDPVEFSEFISKTVSVHIYNFPMACLNILEKLGIEAH